MSPLDSLDHVGKQDHGVGKQKPEVGKQNSEVGKQNPEDWAVLAWSQLHKAVVVRTSWIEI